MTTSTPPQTPPSVTAAFIVRNEGDFLAPSLESVQELADEVVVVDTGSVDHTIDVARQWGARVVTMAWNDDFSAARNRLLAKVSTDWILWLDAAEQLTPESTAEIRDFLNTKASPDTLYMIRVDADATDASGLREQIAQPRLQPSTAALQFTGRVRESLLPSAEAAGMKIDLAPGIVQCHPRRSHPERRRRVAQRNLHLAATELAELPPGPIPARLLLTMGDAHADLNDPTSAREAYRQAIDVAAKGSAEMLEAYHGILSAMNAASTSQQQQIEMALEALEIFPLDAQLLCVMGNFLREQGRLELAQRSFRTAVEHGTIHMETWHLVDIGATAASCLAMTLQLQDKTNEAESVLVQAVAEYPQCARLRRHLVDLYVTLNLPEKALEAAGTWEADSVRRGQMADAIHGACAAAKKNWVVALGCLQRTYLDGLREPFCLQWLTVTLLSTGQVDAARPVLEAWLAREPDNQEALAYHRAISVPQGGATTPDADTQWRIDAAENLGAGESRMVFPPLAIHQASTIDLDGYEPH